VYCVLDQMELVIESDRCIAVCETTTSRQGLSNLMGIESRYISPIIAMVRSSDHVHLHLMHTCIQLCFLLVLAGLGWDLGQTHGDRNIESTVSTCVQSQWQCNDDGHKNVAISYMHLVTSSNHVVPVRIVK
jgi:hypothetical protein